MGLVGIEIGQSFRSSWLGFMGCVALIGVMEGTLMW